MEGGRSRRAIKTPKRFDDEAFVTPTKHISAVRVTPEPTPIQPPKGIIKVKLSSKKTSVSLPKAAETPKVIESPLEIHDQETQDSFALTGNLKAKEVTKIKDIPKVKDSPKVTDVPKVKETPKAKDVLKTKETPKTRDSTKVKDITKVKDVTKAKDITKTREVSKVREVQRVKDSPKMETPRAMIEVPKVRLGSQTIVSRPKTKRPRSPPVYEDVTPNIFLPFWDARTAAEDHDDDNVKELVHCNCGIDEELGLMIQCETCLTWQHAHCLGIENPEDAPDGYTCKACSEPKFARESRRYAYDQEWLTKGKVRKFACDPKPIPEETVDTLKKINSLISESLRIHKLIHGLKVKRKILEKADDDDPELKQFRAKWALGADTTELAATVQINYDSGPDDWRANLREHISEMEAHIGQQVDELQKQLTELEEKASKQEDGGQSSNHSLDSIRNDLETMRRYVSIASRQQQRQDPSRVQLFVFK